MLTAFLQMQEGLHRGKACLHLQRGLTAPAFVAMLRGFFIFLSLFLRKINFGENILLTLIIELIQLTVTLHI